jgi:hypothetical protein
VADSSDGFLNNPESLTIRGSLLYVANVPLVNLVDLETGDFSQAATHTGGAIVTSPALNGTYSLRLQRNSSVANYEIRKSGTTYYNLPTAYYSFLFEYQSLQGETEGSICNFQDTVSGIKSTLHLTVNHQLRFGDLTQWFPTGNTVLTAGQVYRISATIGTGSNAAWEVRINGTVEMSGTGNLGANNNGSLLLGGGSAYTTNYYYDDVTIRCPANQSLIMLDPGHLLQNGHYQQSFVTINGEGFSVPVDLMDVPRDVNSIALPDEGGPSKSDPAGQIWKFTFTDSTHANQSAFGPAFPISPVDYRHPGAMTQDLMNPTTLYPIVGAGGYNGTMSSLGYMDGTAYTTITTNQDDLVYGNGLTMGNGYYGANTIFLNQIHWGTWPNSDHPSRILAINRTTGFSHPVITSSLINLVDFETGDFSQTAAHSPSGATIVTSPALDGTYSLQLQRSTSVANVEIRQSGTTYYNLPTAYYSFMFEYQSLPGETEGSIGNFQDTVSGIKSTLHLTVNHQLRFGDLTQWFPTGNTVLTPGQVYTISAKVGTGTSAAWEVRINGNLEMSGTGNFGANNNGSLLLGGGSPYTTNYYYDEVGITSGYLSTPQGMSMFYTTGGNGYAALPTPKSPATPVIDAQAYNSGFTAAGTMFSSSPVRTLPDAARVLRGTDPMPRQPTEQVTPWSTGPNGRHQLTVQTPALDSFFADWDGTLSREALSTASVL